MEVPPGVRSTSAAGRGLRRDPGLLDLKEGAIQALSFYGDFFSRKEPDQLARRLIGCPLREEALRATVPAGEIGQYFQNMDLDEFCG